MFRIFVVMFLVLDLTTSQETKPTTPSSTTPLSTTLSPASTTPESPQTTTFTPVSTYPPGPLEGSWNVTENNVTCIRAEMAIEFVIHDMNLTIPLSPSASSSRSSCSLTNTTQMLILDYDNYVFSVEFEKDPTVTYVKNITFTYTPLLQADVFYNDSKLFLVKNGNSYQCKSVDHLHLGNATMYIRSIKLQAFATADETGFSKIEECELDDIVSDLVPIAVSCALAGLIIIVLIAYLIGRRKVRQRGYLSV